MTSRLNLRQLEAFRATMHAGTVVAAAGLLNVTQPAVSRLVAELERRIGFALFERRGRRLSPTAEAQQLYREIERLQLGVERVAQVAADIKLQRAGAVRLAVLPALAQWFAPVYGDFVLMLRGDVGYADGYNNKSLPFYKVFYGGGVGSVRGYETASLGPRDIYGNTLGGKRKIIGNAELFYPVLKGDKSVRASVFVDAGQISGLTIACGDTPELCAAYKSAQKESEKFRYSYGVGLAWNSPVGPLKFSYAYPINSIPEDKIQNFQFQVGTVF